MYIDSHSHLYLPQFDEDRDQVMQRALETDLERIYLPNIERNSFAAMMSLVRRYPDLCFPMIGLHPCSVKLSSYREELAFVKQQLESETVFSAIGETGTDLYWDKTYREQQLEAFEQQINWAKSYDLPIVIHSRETLSWNIEIIARHQDGNLRGVFHCFNGDAEQAKEIADLGFFMGLGGVVTFKNAGMNAVVPHIPMEHILLETDAPYLTPTPYRGQRNESSYLPLIAKKVAIVKELTVEEVATKTRDNALRLFEK